MCLYHHLTKDRQVRREGERGRGGNREGEIEAGREGEERERQRERERALLPNMLGQ